jgi:hypothetical protein
MYEHRHLVEIVALDLIRFGATSKGLATTAMTPVFGGNFVRDAGLRAVRRSPSGWMSANANLRPNPK